MDSYVYELFEKLHSMPEVAFAEYQTSAFLAAELEKHGYEVWKNVGGKTGVIGILNGSEPGPVIALRADMDALPFEIGGKSVAIHACGHDAHSAITMSIAGMFAEKGLNRGKLVIIFQPAEETGAGSLSIIESGLVDDVKEIVGAHIRPVSDFAFGKATPAIYHSASANPVVKITGRSAHGANPHLGVNAVEAAILAAGAVSLIKANPSVRHSIKPTRITDGGNAVNTIPDEATLAFDIRSHSNDEMEKIIAAMKNAVTAAVASIGATAAFENENFSEAAVYDAGMKITAREAIGEVLGGENCLPDFYINGGEDFHKYAVILGCKAIYAGIGADARPGLHSKDMTFNHKAMEYGRDILKLILEKRFAEHSASQFEIY